MRLRGGEVRGKLTLSWGQKNIRQNRTFLGGR